MTSINKHNKAVSIEKRLMDITVRRRQETDKIGCANSGSPHSRYSAAGTLAQSESLLLPFLLALLVPTPPAPVPGFFAKA